MTGEPTRPLLQHPAARPSWECATCGRPWPCPPARAEISGGASAFAVALYMGLCYQEAAEELPGTPLVELHRRFLGWRIPAIGLG